jgi:SAM-dependent methyltransferase
MAVGTWLLAARARRNVQRALRPLGPVDATIDQVAKPGRSFADIGALWSVHGRTAFMAEEKGASPVTAVDVSAATPEFESERERRGSSVRFVRGDVHDPDTLAAIGPHDVVWCSGVLYHCPNPVHTIECLRSITRETLVLITASVPEVPGIRNGSVFFPGLSERARRSYDRAFNAASNIDADRVGLTTPFDPDDSYAAWWWGLTPSSIEAMLTASRFKVAETKTNGFHTRIVANLA